MTDTTESQARRDLMERKAGELADHRAALARHLAEANEDLRELMGRWSERLKKAADHVGDSERELIGYVEMAPYLFKRPQSIEVDGVRFGLRKGKGRIEYADEAKLIQRIEKQLTRGQRGPVLKITKKVRKGPLAQLSAEILKRLGVNVTAAGTEAFVSYPKSKLDKAVDWWLKPSPQAEDDEADES
jgi:hypothetical protein